MWRRCTVISWLPFYYTAKLMFLLWLQLPYFRGALFLYERYVKLFFQQHEHEIDDTIAALGKSFMSLLVKWMAAARDLVADKVLALILKRPVAEAKKPE